LFNFIVRRLILLVPVLLVVAVVAFLATRIMPGDPVILVLGDFAPPEKIDAMRLQLGLDKPIFIQFVIWVQHILRGDLGHSLFLNMPVTQAIIGRLEPTLLLALIGQSLGILIGIPLGILAAVRHRTWIDQGSIVISLIGISIPSFWLALLLIMVFSVKLHLLPSSGYMPVAEAGLGAVKYLVLPGVTLGFMQSAIIARMTRSSMLDILNQDFIRTARAKGLTEKVVILQHALRNALIPVVTVMGFSMAVLLGGTWIVETLFNIPGTGSLAITAIMRRDYPIIQGSMIFTAGIYVLVNLLVDISYAVINPRIKYG
jgi:peptide/nickel transport system permease protein